MNLDSFYDDLQVLKSHGFTPIALGINAEKQKFYVFKTSDEANRAYSELDVNAGGKGLIDAVWYALGEATIPSTVLYLDTVKQQDPPSFDFLRKRVIQWGIERNLISEENTWPQFAKVVEEVGEIGKALAKKDEKKFVDGVGDSIVTLILLAADMGYDIEYCLAQAYEEIKDRKGKTVNGQFFKEGE